MHIGLAVAVGFTLGSLVPHPLIRVLIIGLALLPLLASLRGLAAGRSVSLRWIAVALVAYAGLGAVEAIARGHPAAIAVLLLALLELAVVFILTRAARPQSPRATGES
jgi:hypothetical protein